MTAFKVGDRVALYCYEGRRVGIVEKILRDNVMEIIFDNNNFQCALVHPKQCRKLVKKKKKECEHNWNGYPSLYFEPSCQFCIKCKIEMYVKNCACINFYDIKKIDQLTKNDNESVKEILELKERVQKIETQMLKAFPSFFTKPNETLSVCPHGLPLKYAPCASCEMTF